MTTQDQVFKNKTSAKIDFKDKVTIVGSGSAGTSIAFSILLQGISNDVVIISRNEDKIKGELLDLQHSIFVMRNARVTGGSDLSLTIGSKLIIFAAGVRQIGEEIYFDQIQQNVRILKDYLTKLIRLSPNAILLIVSNPCEILCYVAWKLTGWSIHRIIGVGTHLNSSRFRFLLSQKFDIATNSVQGWIIGEQGKSSVPIWSSVNFSGMRLIEMNPAVGADSDQENWLSVYEEASKIEGQVRTLKGFSSWGIALSCSEIASAIFQSSNDVHAVSTLVRGFYGIQSEVFLSLPCVLSSNGISSIVNIKLNDDERRKLRSSANEINELQKGINF